MVNDLGLDGGQSTRAYIDNSIVTAADDVTLKALTTSSIFALAAGGSGAVAGSKGIDSSQYDAFLLAAVAPVPLWLSALVLFANQFALIVAMVLLGVAGSVVLIFRGVKSILKVEEGLVAFDIAYTVTALGLIAWVVLVTLGIVPALA